MTTSTDWDGLVFGGKNAKKYKNWRCWRTFLAFSKIACNFIILVHRLSLCFYFVRVYKSPTISNRLQSLRYYKRQIISKTKSVTEHFEGAVYGRTELNHHADTTVSEVNCIIFKYTDRSCMVSPYYDQKYEPIHNVSIVTAATGYTSKMRGIIFWYSMNH